MNSLPQFPFRKIRSFTRRDSRATKSQLHAFETLAPHYRLDASNLSLNLDFLHTQACFLEIGFGGGQSLATLALENPQLNFIGIETYKPGIGSLLITLEKHNLKNVKIIYQDVMEAFAWLPPAVLAGILIFFPDPWPKRRHNQRRLVQQDFLKLAISRLKKEGLIHIATDWEDYAKHIMYCLSLEKTLINLAGENNYSGRSLYRPIITKFEGRAIRENRKIWEFAFTYLQNKLDPSTLI